MEKEVDMKNIQLSTEDIADNRYEYIENVKQIENPKLGANIKDLFFYYYNLKLNMKNISPSLSEHNYILN